jgi:hypothetical protein
VLHYAVQQGLELTVVKVLTHQVKPTTSFSPPVVAQSEWSKTSGESLADRSRCGLGSRLAREQQVAVVVGSLDADE